MKHFFLVIFSCSTLFTSAQNWGGPDQYGYVWRNNMAPAGPVFNWIDIDSLPGTITVTGLFDDNIVGPFPMPIAFQYYGYIPTNFWIGSNGYVSFSDDDFLTYSPIPNIPDTAGLNNYLAVMTADLTFSDIASQPIPGVTCKYWSNANADSLVITFANVPFYDVAGPYFYIGSNTFQVIFSVTDNTILYQYLEQIGMYDTSIVDVLTIGIEDPFGNIGLEVMHDIYPLPGSAIRFEGVDVNVIRGTVFMDWNSNSVQDTNDYGLKFSQVNEQSTGYFAMSNDWGNYSLPVLSSGSFAVMAPTFNNNYYTVSPASHTVLFPALNLTDSLNDFAVQPLQIVNDLSVNITPMSAFRPGFDAHYSITCFNHGTTVLSPEIYFYPDSQLSYISSALVPDIITNDSVTWMLPPLNPMQHQTFNVVVRVDSTTIIASSINSSVSINPVAGDNSPDDNVNFWELFVTGSFDPNDIMVNRDTLFTTEMTSPPFLEYIIRFQNTGNDTAFNVKIVNPISANLNMNTFELIETSSPVEFKYYDNNRLTEYRFNNILLPDSNTNEPLSHGYVRYRIKPNPGLVAGTEILDSAGIYFDFNTAVMTNTAITRITFPTVGVFEKDDSFPVSLYPNPASEMFTITFSLERSASIKMELMDLPGQLIANLSYNYYPKGLQRETISLSSLAEGIYFLRMTIDEKVFYKRVVKL